ncbi:hypothetical protein PV04_00621 [Phialophora macrospora]|uniref:Uncharacterized protein n=1 Tax=Phialophora macrospora TaxID=1851006 RepID=A0A0D2D4E3_9EURO|nr:hypothetical protein PV04_00621 [Phialophora macrospora]
MRHIVFILLVFAAAFAVPCPTPAIVVENNITFTAPNGGVKTVVPQMYTPPSNAGVLPGINDDIPVVVMGHGAFANCTAFPQPSGRMFLRTKDTATITMTTLRAI